MEKDVFHEGELAVQRKLGREKEASRLKRMIAPVIFPGMVPFIELQTVIFVGSTDVSGQPWSSVLYGDLGFLKVLDRTELLINPEKIKSPKSDVFFRNIEVNPEIGFLFIQHESRTRFRVNGHVTKENGILKVQVVESYGNCPKYIQAGKLILDNAHNADSSLVSEGTVLGPAELDLISRSNTFYVSSRNKDGRMDTSHRGGNDGFVSITTDGTLMIPDYPGNNLFNTLGNIHQYPKTGLLFMDHETGTVLQLVGEAEILYGRDSEKELAISGDTGVFWEFRTTNWIHTEGHYRGAWELYTYSPFNPVVE
ncbi:pyridoxamine 5'-phosphate oxidase family protein [Flagellimonas sp.]|uniref:pyridoxamine 5'-phosphate oxidase family protein n=1 Tax=Flagellimonas sp. TaxID=2058762 RepID=UPI003F49F02A